ncbi:hypothetical protein KIL84_008649 [Mauremys mutica]|uniref:Uncharacterized protein n=1 Tax=Mauremys mutica TaxID=74926 RepID=A0A9D4AXY4_9SAUR|nr:hypothetical protein KIL84_008649 [Mauremys mutica]
MKRQPGWRLWSNPAWHWPWPANKPPPRFWGENRGSWSMGVRDSLTAPPGKQRLAVRSGGSPAHLDRASLRGGSSCHFVFGTDDLKEPQAAAAGLFPPPPSPFNLCQNQLLAYLQSTLRSDFLGSQVFFVQLPRGPWLDRTTSCACGLSLWRQRDAAPFPYCSQRGKRTGFPPPSKTFVASCGAGQQRNSPPPLERDRSSFTFPSRACWLSRVTWLFALLCQDPDPSVQTLEPLAGEVPHCTLGG